MFEQIVKVFKDYKDDQELVVTAESTFADLELDSLDVVDLMMRLEEEFSVTIEMDDSITTVGALVKVIEAAV